MNDSWIQIASFATGVEAEMAREQLRSAGIAALIHAEGSGLFGAGFGGALPSGAALSVPRDAADEARSLLEGITS